MDIRTELNYEQWTEFRHYVKDAGIQTDPWYEAVKYSGPSKILHTALCASRRSTSKEYIVVGNDHKALQSIAYYISNIPYFHSWMLGIETGQWELKNGYFAIVEKCGFRGGDKRSVADLLIRFGIDESLIEYTLNKVTKKILGYVLSTCEHKASAVAEAVKIGALSPDYDGTLAIVRFITERAESLL